MLKHEKTCVIPILLTKYNVTVNLGWTDSRTPSPMLLQEFKIKISQLKHYAVGTEKNRRKGLC